MLNSIKTKVRELFGIQSNAKNSHNSISGNRIEAERTPVEGTPFTMAKDETGYTLLLGMYQITPRLKTAKQVEDYWKKNEWNIIINVIHSMLNFHKLIQSPEQEQKEDKQAKEFAEKIKKHMKESENEQ